MRSFMRSFSLVILLLQATCVVAQEKLLLADARHRPPDIIVDESSGIVSGPLVDAFNDAAKGLGYKVQWRIAPFMRTLKDLENGKIDIVPGLFMNETRKSFIEFLGPIGEENSPVHFLVKKGQEHQLKSYDDLKKMSIGVKRGTVYFEPFDSDQTIKRIDSKDDDNMVQMLAIGRFDAMIVNDKSSAQAALFKNKIEDMVWADYAASRRTLRYYGMSKLSKHLDIAKPLSDSLQSMATNGRMRQIFQSYGIAFNYSQ